MSDEPKKRSRVDAVLDLSRDTTLLVLYPLSVGPAFGSLSNTMGGVQRESVETIYEPIDWIRCTSESLDACFSGT